MFLNDTVTDSFHIPILFAIGARFFDHANQLLLHIVILNYSDDRYIFRHMQSYMTTQPSVNTMVWVWMNVMILRSPQNTHKEKTYFHDRSLLYMSENM